MKKLLFAFLLVALFGAGMSWAQPDAKFEGKTAAEWITTLEGPNFMDRRAAARALGNMGPAVAKVAVPALIKSLRDKDEQVRDWSCWALKTMGAEAKEAVPALVDAMKTDTASNVRWSAANALGQIGPDAKAAIPALMNALRDDDPWLRWNAAIALSGMGPDAKVAIPRLVKALYDSEYIVRNGAVTALRDLGPIAREAIPDLIKTAKDEIQFDTVRKMAADIVKKLDPEAAKREGFK
jgi:HEAT repeat protein